MIVTKITQSKFELDFDEHETEILSDMETLFETAPADAIQRSLDQAMRDMKLGTTDLVDRVTSRVAVRRNS